MKLVHVNAKSTVDVHILEEKLKELPEGRWGVVTTIQHLHKLDDVLSQLKDAVKGGQVLGCNAIAAEKIKEQVDQWLFVGSGEFHPIQVALKTAQPVWTWNPFSQELKKLDQQSVDRFKKRVQGSIATFLEAQTVGILVTMKMGQKNLGRALELAKRDDKAYYVFVCDELVANRFEDFPFIQCWVNTACPRIADEKVNVVNVNDLVEAGIVTFTGDAEVPIWESELGLQ